MKPNNYFEGMLQLRDCKEEVYKYVKERMKEEKVTIANSKEFANGVDHKVSSNPFLIKMSTELPKHFSGEVKITRKLYSRDHLTQKEIYRITVLFKQYPFKIGEIIDNRGDQVKVISISKSKVTVKDIKTGKKSFLAL